MCASAGTVEGCYSAARPDVTSWTGHCREACESLLGHEAKYERMVGLIIFLAIGGQNALSTYLETFNEDTKVTAVPTK